MPGDSPSPPKAVEVEWVHRTVVGIEYGGEEPSGKASGPFRALWEVIRLTWSRREMLSILVVQDFKARYRGQALGLFWSLAYPLVTMVTITIAFSRIMRVGVPNFPVFYLIGAVFWHLFTNGLLAATGTMMAHSSLVKRTTFPRHLLPIAAVLSHVIHFEIESVLLFAFFFLFPDAYLFNASLLALPVLALLLVMLLIGAGLFTSALYVRYRDLHYVVSSLITVGFWGTPILFPTEMAPERMRPWLRLNPLCGIIEGARGVLMRGEWPSWQQLLPSVVGAVGLLVLGILTFRRLNLQMADYA